MAFKFENLKVWQRAIELSGEVYELTETFPKKELYVLTSQIQRASDSIVLDIAEGSTGQTTPEFKRFLAIALRSAIEMVCCLHLGRRRGLIDQIKFDYFYQFLTDLVKSLQALRNSIQ